MADTGIMATTQEVQDKVGAFASSTYNAEAYINRFVAQAESMVNSETKYNWSDVYSTLNSDVQKLLTLAVSCKAAIFVISADMSGYPTTGMALNHLNVLDEEYRGAIRLLQDDNVRAFILEA